MKIILLALLVLYFGICFSQSESNFAGFDGQIIKDTIVDNRDNEIYKVIKVKNQIWLAENLRFKPDSGKYWCPEKDCSLVENQGYLYNWKTAQNVCPCGYRLPSKEDYEGFFEMIGNDNTAYKLTQSEEIGFNALSVGAKYGVNFVPYGYGVTFWTSNSKSKIYACGLGIAPNDKDVKFGYKFTKKSGLTIRCVKILKE